MGNRNKVIAEMEAKIWKKELESSNSDTNIDEIIKILNNNFSGMSILFVILLILQVVIVIGVFR